VLQGASLSHEDQDSETGEDALRVKSSYPNARLVPSRRCTGYTVERFTGCSTCNKLHWAGCSHMRHYHDRRCWTIIGLAWPLALRLSKRTIGKQEETRRKQRRDRCT
jgi:hypothetical protein